MKWEYWECPGYWVDAGKQMQWLNQMGEQGWELVSIWPHPDKDYEAIFFFKRVIRGIYESD